MTEILHLDGVELLVDSPGAPRVVTLDLGGVELLVDSPGIPATVTSGPQVPTIVGSPDPVGAEVLPVRGAPGLPGQQGPQGEVGPQGPPGPQGSGIELVYEFSVPSKQWICTHTFDRRILDVVTVDINGQEIVGDVHFPSVGTVVIDWYYSTAGTARIST